MQDGGELVLLALDPVGVARLVGDEGEVEDGPAAGLHVEDLPGRRFLAHGDEGLADTKLIEIVEGRRMEGRGAQVDGKAVGSLQNHGRHSFPSKPQRTHQTDRPCTHDDNRHLP